MDATDVIDSIGNDLKISIDDLVHQIKIIKQDVEKIKNKDIKKMKIKTKLS